MDRERLMKQGQAARTGGKGTARRKNSGPSREKNREEQKFQKKFNEFKRSLTWRRVGVQEAVFVDSPNIMMFERPSVAACNTQNIWIVVGRPMIVDIGAFFTALVSQLGIELGACEWRMELQNENVDINIAHSAAHGDDMQEVCSDRDNVERGNNEEGQEVCNDSDNVERGNNEEGQEGSSTEAEFVSTSQ